MTAQEKRRLYRWHKKQILAAAVALASCTPMAYAFEVVASDDSDWNVRFDNTFKLSYGVRVERPNDDLTRTANSNDGDLNFKRGRPVNQRADVLSELDVVYKSKMGFRVTAASWYDAAYENVGNSRNLTPNRSSNNGKVILARPLVTPGGTFPAGTVFRPNASGTLVPTTEASQADGLSNFADRFYNGPSGEILDAFVFMNHEFEDGKQLGVKVGRHTQFWGESLFNIANGNSFGQSALDLGKLYSVPGTESKELFRPRNQISATMTLSPEWTVGGQYFLEYEHARFPEGGSYYGPYDLALDGGETFFVPLPTAGGGAGAFLGVPRGRDVKPRQRGDFGVMAKWSPAWLDGTLGMFYREFTDILPNVLIDQTNPASPTYYNSFGSGIKLYGLSLSKNVGSVSVGADLNYRRNMTLASNFTAISPLATASTPNAISARPGEGESGTARGNTIQGVLNGVTVFGDSPFWDGSALAVELNWTHLVNVTEGENTYKGNDSYRGVDKATRNAYGIAASFTPTWFSVLPSVDLSAPISANMGIGGDSAVNFGSYRNAGSYSVGLAADVKAKYRVDLRYVDAFGTFKTCKSGTDSNAPGPDGMYRCIPGQVTSFDSLGPLLKDRGMVSLSVKMTF